MIDNVSHISTSKWQPGLWSSLCLTRQGSYYKLTYEAVVSCHILTGCLPCHVYFLSHIYFIENEPKTEAQYFCNLILKVHPKGDQSWVFIGRTDVEAETPILWPPHEKSWLIGKDPDAGKDWGQEEKGTTEDEMVGWHHQLNGHEFE